MPLSLIEDILFADILGGLVTVDRDGSEPVICLTEIGKLCLDPEEVTA